MFSEQRESGIRMAEFRPVQDIPSCRRVAFRAIPVKPALMVDLVTIEAFRMLYLCEAHIIGIVRRSAVHDHRVAFLAKSFPMPTGQFEVGLVMIEAGNAFPGIERVALTAIDSQLSPVFVGMAAQAVTRKPQERPGEILLPRP
jgi:hypothetical protein